WLSTKSSRYVMLMSILYVIGIPVDAQKAIPENFNTGSNEIASVAFHKKAESSLSSFVTSTNQNSLADHRLNGIVTDDSGKPLPNVSVQIKGTSLGVITDASGKFSLMVPDNAVLSVSFVGYETQEIAVNN